MSLIGLGNVADLIGKVIDKIVPDKDAALKAKTELLKLQQTGQLAELAAEAEVIKGQLAVNAEEAKHASVFVAGWRPFIGWICGVALGLQFVLFPLAIWAAQAAGRTMTTPPMDTAALWNITLGMLGMAGWRTFEKIKGVSK